jgi:transposase
VRRRIHTIGEQAHNAAEGRLLLDTIGRLRSSETDRPPFLLMDRAYEDLETRLRAFQRSYGPAVPPKKNRKHPWKYDKARYKRCNEVERMFRRPKRFRRTGTRYDKLDVVFSAFIRFALCLVAVCSLLLHCVNTP